ncbi:HlyD family secretion protein [Antarcticirhabdus aurantiaca]|uniref:HlyD family secretion protein n=1 Tax=Antarcticirhabdus aurantiaca TaxID=2606717 RepID=A0ACD4NQH5_9HYPH|nr:HlyD family secretion protein [Antarcticirhabdus aurantiaca]WAJ29100.1 HlyD family secretion protein [Jeongeuplla avenae]
MAAPAFLRSSTTLAALAVGVAGVLLVLHAWNLPPFASSVQTTDDAYVRGAVTVIGSQLAAPVAAVHVKDFQAVKAGDPLLDLDDRIYRQRLAQQAANLADAQGSLAGFDAQRASAQAEVQVAEAQLRNAQAGLQGAQTARARVAPLVSENFASEAQRTEADVAVAQAEASVAQAEASIAAARQRVETVERSRANLEAAVQGAEAALRLAEIDLANTRITAPQDGRLGEVRIRKGQYVAAGTQLVSLVPPEVWVIANYKETQVAGMAVGQPATVRVDALGRAALEGTIRSFSPATGSEFSVIRTDNATGNFVKIPQRVPIRIEFEPDQEAVARLSPGLSVVVSVDVAAQATPQPAVPVDPAR